MISTSSDSSTAREHIASHATEEKKLYPVVAIGASAGGLEALSGLLEHLPVDLGLVYVIIQHLSPSHESILPELLERRTTMPVHKVTHGMPIEQNHIYVIPPNTYMSIVDSLLTLSPRFKTNGGYHSIDFFMTALAQVYQNLAVGVVLSGTATDGTDGIRHIKAEGGITFAQDESARFQGMPRSAADSGCIDYVLSPEDIAKELTEIAKKPLEYKPESFDETGISNDGEMKKIQALLHNRKDVDFSFYKQTTIKRRILRRMALNRLKSLDDYTKLVRNDAKELDLLYRDLLINVTDFFREPTVYQALTDTIFPALLKDRRANDPIRIWCPACATGEEVVSIAICLFEFLKDQAMTTPIQIFGTDLSEAAIEKARAGFYAPSALHNVSSQRLKRFFIKPDGKYQIIKAIRDVCVFARQNLLKDPPFSRMDLISCQNVMIYLETDPQKKILQSFHYGLKPSGYLLLGKSESIGNASDLFSQVDKDLKIYLKKPNSSPSIAFDFVQRNPQVPYIDAGTPNEPPLKERDSEIDIEKETERLLLSRYVPASIVVNSDYNIFRFHGPVYKYLEPASGKATLNLLKMVRNDLVYELRSLIHRAKKENQPIRRDGIILVNDGRQSEIRIEIVPIKSNAQEAYFLVLFEEQQPAQDAKPDTEKKRVKKPGENEQRITQLEYELKEAREQMKSMTEEFEATREELQSANEEILSSNEELQSINEELETSKEELQSTNEELTTINEELRIRNNDLKEAIDYSIAIVETMREPLVLLDADLRVRTANKAFYRTFKMAPPDTEGQYLYEINDTTWNIPELLVKLSDVASKKKPIVTFELSHIFMGRILLFNAMHLQAEGGKKDRILLTIQDITLQRQAQETKEWLATVVTSSGEGIISFSPSRTIISWNKGAEEIFGYTADEMIGKSMGRLVQQSSKAAQHKLFEQVIGGTNVRQFETIHVHKNGHLIDVAVSISPIKDEKGVIKGLVTLVQDITQRKKSEKEIISLHDRLTQALQVTNAGWADWNLLTDKIFWSKSSYEIMGFTSGEETTNSQEWLNLMHPDDRIKVEDRLKKAMDEHTGFNAEYRITHADGSTRTILGSGTVYYDEDEKPVRITGIVVDITGRKKADEELQKSEERFRGIVSQTAVGIARSDFEGRLLFVNKQMGKMLGFEPEELTGRIIWELMPDDDVEGQKAVFEQIQKEGSSFQFDKRLISKNKKPLWVNLNLSALKDDDGGAESATIVVVDISTQRESAENLEKIRESLQVALEAANMGTWEIDTATGIATYHNLRHDQVYGYATLQPVWTTATTRACIIDEDKHKYDDALKRMSAKGDVMHMEVRVRWPDGSIHWIYKLGRLFNDAAGKPLRAAGIVMDITERKMLERQKDEFIGVASHELRTPVTSIKAYAQILQEQFTQQEDTLSASMLGKLDKQVDKLTNLIKDLLDVTRIAEGQLTLHPESFNLNDLVNEQAEDMQRIAQRHTIVKELQQPLPPVTADKERIGQVITNLISNAIKYSPGASKIVIKTEQAGASVRLSVQDFGIGMSAEAQQKVFERFYRANDPKTSTFPGLGLGLFISSEIIKRHNGDIGVSSKENEGSVFHFSLPAAE